METFALTSPFFLPPVVAGVLMLVRTRAVWLKVLAEIFAIGVPCAFSVSRSFFG